MRLYAYPEKRHNEEEGLGGGRENADQTRVTNIPVCLELSGFLDVGFSVLKAEKSWTNHQRHWVFNFK